MRSIIYAGHDFSELCSAEVVARSANPIAAEALQVPGSAGAMLVTGYLPPVDYASVSTLAADVAALQDDVTGIDGNMSTAASVQVVESIVAEAIGELDELDEVEF